MVRRGLVARLLLALVSALAVPACRGGGAAPDDGGLDTPGSDVPAGDVPGALALSIAVTGCATYDLGMAGMRDAAGEPARCTGAPPLTLSFAPVSSAALTRFLWTFGDGTAPSSERVPAHTYVLPGTYDVTLVAEGDVGSVSVTQQGFVVVSAVPAGAPCDVDAQCGKDLRCLCGAGAACGAAFARGICTAACDQKACGAGTVCAALAAPAVVTEADGGADAGADGGADAGADGAADADAASDAAADSAGGGPAPPPLCLAGCTADSTCPAGLACRALPAAGGTQGWTRACVPPAFRDVGASCRDAAGALDDGACATGLCADLGALGLCSAACGAGAACPAGTACAALGDGRALCLRPCDAAFTCARDPLLRCEAGGGAGALGFQVTPPVAGATYCAPRRCAAAAECAPAGACAPPGAGGHCQLP